MSAAISTRSVPRAFVWRRLHSLTGLWFLLFLMEHLFTNSQAAIFFGTKAEWFVNSVGFLHSLPYLPIIELVLLGVPMGIHIFWGIRYLMTSKSNVVSHQGKTPSIKKERNKAYSMQRITSWVILFGLICHVVQMRFIMYPVKIFMGNYSQAFGKYTVDAGFYKVCDELGVFIYDERAIESEKQALARLKSKITLVDQRFEEINTSKSVKNNVYNQEMNELYKNINDYQEKVKFVGGLTHFKIKPGEVIVGSRKSDLILLNVREAFQSFWMCTIYTLFVLASVIHGCNGFWTFCITWGLLLSKKAQSTWVSFAYGLAFILIALGMLSIWGSYFFSAGYFK